MKTTTEKLNEIMKPIRKCYCKTLFNPENNDNYIFWDDNEYRKDLLSIETKYLKEYFDIKKSKNKNDLIDKILNQTDIK